MNLLEVSVFNLTDFYLMCVKLVCSLNTLKKKDICINISAEKTETGLHEYAAALPFIPDQSTKKAGCRSDYLLYVINSNRHTHILLQLLTSPSPLPGNT